MNMAVFNAVGEMAKRGVGLTLLNHHCELADPNGSYDKNSVLYDSMGLWVVGKFDIEKARIATAAEHISGAPRIRMRCRRSTTVVGTAPLRISIRRQCPMWSALTD